MLLSNTIKNEIGLVLNKGFTAHNVYSSLGIHLEHLYCGKIWGNTLKN